MSLVTTRLGLIKPAGIEQFSLATYNKNLDDIDAGVNTGRKGRNARFYSALTKPAPVAGNGYTFGPLGIDAGKPLWTQNNDFCVAENTGSLATDTGKIKITKAGFYDISSGYMPAANPGNMNFAFQITNNPAGNDVIPMSRVGTYGDWGAHCAVTGVYLAVGAYIEGYQANSNAVSFNVWVNMSYKGEGL